MNTYLNLITPFHGVFMKKNNFYLKDGWQTKFVKINLISNSTLIVLKKLVFVNFIFVKVRNFIKMTFNFNH